MGVGARGGETLRTGAQGRRLGPGPRAGETLRTGAQGRHPGPGSGAGRRLGPGCKGDAQDQGPGWGDTQDQGPGETPRTGGQGRRSGPRCGGQPPCHDHREEVGGPCRRGAQGFCAADRCQESLKEDTGPFGPERLTDFSHEEPCFRPRRPCVLPSGGEATAVPSCCREAGSGPRASSQRLRPFRGVWPTPRVWGMRDTSLPHPRWTGPLPTPPPPAPSTPGRGIPLCGSAQTSLLALMSSTALTLRICVSAHRTESSSRVGVGRAGGCVWSAEGPSVAGGQLGREAWGERPGGVAAARSL